MKFIKKIKDKSIAKASFLTLSSNLISQITSFFVVILLSRSMSVANYGLYSILNSISTFVSDMADMGMNGAITRFVAEFRSKKEFDKEKQLIDYAITKKFRNLIAVFIILSLCAKPIATHFLNDERLHFYVYFITLSCTFSLFVGAMRAIIQGRQEYEKYFISVVSWNLIWCITIVILYCLDKMTIATSIIAGAISGFVNLILCIKLINYDLKSLFLIKKIPDDVKNKFNKFGNWMLLWSVFALLQSKVDIFMLATLTTSEQVSYYDIASKIIKPVLMVISSYAQVLNPLFASSTSNEMLNKRVKDVTKFILCVTGLIIICIIVVRPAILIVFGTKYVNSIFPAQLLFVAIIFYVWTVPFNCVLYAINKPHVFTLAAIIGLIATIIGNYFLLGQYGAIGAAITYILAQVVGLIVALFAYLILYKFRKGID